MKKTLFFALALCSVMACTSKQPSEQPGPVNPVIPEGDKIPADAVPTLVQVDSLGWRETPYPKMSQLQPAMTVSSEPIQLHFFGWDKSEDYEFHLKFPEDMSPYGLIQLVYTMGGWNEGPAEWDMTTQIMIHDKQADEWYEISRCITPYGGSFGPDWKRTYYMDVSEFAPLLAGDAEFRVFYCGWDATEKRAHTAQLSFELYPLGNPYGEVVWHQKIYDSTLNGNTGYRSWAYGVQGDGNSIEEDERLGLRTIELPEGLTSALLRVCFTGHGQDALTKAQGTFPNRPGYSPVNTAEFDYNYYTINLCGEALEKRGYIWEKNDKNYRQAGTYKYDRCGWGPGKPANVQHWLMENIATDGRSITLDFDLDEYISKNTSPRAESVAQFYVEVDIFGFCF